MDLSSFVFEAGALLPSIGIGLLFWFILRAILRSDRLQREAEREAEAEYLREHPEHAQFASQANIPSTQRLHD